MSLSGCSRPALHELQRLEAEDRLDRLKRRTPPAELALRDAERAERVVELNAKGRLRTAEERFLGALILQHGQGPAHFLLGHELAAAAAAEGYEDAKLLAALNQDRYRMSMGLPQWYGTQLRYNEATSRWELYPVEGLLSDEERAEWGVKPLSEMRRIAERMNREGAGRLAVQAQAADMRAWLDAVRSSTETRRAPR